MVIQKLQFDGTTFNIEKVHEAAGDVLAGKQIEYTADMKATLKTCLETGNI